MKIKISGRTDVGLERVNNEDAFAFCPNLLEANWGDAAHQDYVITDYLGACAIVADGMGGANAGEMASSIAIESIKQDFVPKNIASVITSEDSIRSFLKDIILKANDAILKHVESDINTIGMGTTIVLIWILGPKAYVAWCGDSRCYVFNHKKGLKALSKDHSLVQELIDNKQISIEESYTHPDSSIITRCLGDCDASAEAEVVVYNINKNDIFLLCSDGLCGYCSEKDILKNIYRNYTKIDECCSSLINLALKTGGQDNVTVLGVSTIEDEETSISVTFPDKIRQFFKQLF